MKKLVSIIVPCFNSETTIQRCIESICAQNYVNIQIICVNDGSTDATKCILGKLCARDSRLHLINKENGGVSSARNTGLHYASGEYIQFVDCDDKIDPDMTSQLVKELEQSNSDLVLCGYHSNKQKVSCALKSATLSKEEMYANFEKLYFSTYLNPPWNKLYKRKLIYDQFPEDIKLGEDLIFNLLYLKNVNTIRIISATPYLYTIGNVNSLTSRFDSNSFVYAEKKITAILNFLPEVVYSRIQNILADEFMLDYLRCLRGLIVSNKFTDKELVIMINEYCKSSFWKNNVLLKVKQTGDALLLFRHEEKKFIRQVRQEASINRIKQIFKKMLKYN